MVFVGWHSYTGLYSALLIIICTHSYINLPIGGLTLVACFFLLPQPKATSVSYRQRTIKIMKEIDWIGTGLVLATLIMLLMAL